MLRGTAAEAERILQDAVGKLDDPLHLRCTSSPGRATAAGARALLFPTSHPPTHPEGGGQEGAGASGQALPLTGSPCAGRLPGEQGPGCPGCRERPGEGPRPVPDLQGR